MIGVLTIGLIGLALCTKNGGVASIGSTWYGGNSGYDGYSMSMRAKQAREDGRYPKTDFKREYKIDDMTLEALVDLGVIANNEWHHTSKFGNKTKFYYWLDDSDFEEIYKPNKAEIKKCAKNGDYAIIAELFNVPYNDYGTDYIRVGDYMNSVSVSGKTLIGKVVKKTPRYIYLDITDEFNGDEFVFTSAIDRFTINKHWHLASII